MIPNGNGRAMDSGPVRVAVVGYGYWGPNVARNLAVSDSTLLLAVCDLDPAARDRAAKLLPGVRVTPDWDALLADPDIEAIVVALPIQMHYRFGREVLEAGKHVLVEKPLAQSVAQCDALAACARAAERVLMVGHTFEFNAAVRMVGDYLRGGELGDPYYVSMRRTNLGIVRSDLNAMWSLAPHDISILNSWLGQRAVSVSATGATHLQDGIEDVVFMTIQYEGGALGHVHTSWLDPNKVREAVVVGSRKMAVYDDTSPDMKIRLYDKGIDRAEPRSERSLGRYETFSKFQMIARAGDILVPKVNFGEPLAAEFDHFAECVREGAAPITDAANGRAVVAVLEAAQRSLEFGGAIQAVVAAERLEAPV